VSAAKGLARRLFTEETTVRLISTAYIDEPAMAPLADTAGELAILETLEGLTSPRRSPLPPVPGGLDPSELLGEADGYGHTYVNAAFCYTRTTGNRFNGPERGAWYAAWGADRVATAQAEVGWHLTRELAATGVYDNRTAYRELLAGFTAEFHELAARTKASALDPDPAVAYPAGQRLAREVLEAGGNGLLYPSARHENGQCLAAFRPRLVQNVRQGDTWLFDWAGSPVPGITRLAR
jgi:hypothetical protein